MHTWNLARARGDGGNTRAHIRAAWWTIANSVRFQFTSQHNDCSIFLVCFLQVQLVSTFNGGFLAVAFAVSSFIGNFIFYYSGLYVLLL